MNESDISDLKYAKELLDDNRFAMKLMHTFGIPFEKGLAMLPERWSGKIHEVTEKALNKALDCAVLTMKADGPGNASERWHRAAVALSGGIGGLFGAYGLSVELPITTMIMLRSIADIARSEGEVPHSLETRLACIEVFAFGSHGKHDDGRDTGYYAIRGSLQKMVNDAAQFILTNGLKEKSAPALVRLINAIATRFGVVVSEKLAAEAIPIVGAAGGILINSIFIDHFQQVARGHFIVRRLERTNDPDTVRRLFQEL